MFSFDSGMAQPALHPHASCPPMGELDKEELCEQLAELRRTVISSTTVVDKPSDELASLIASFTMR